MIHRILSIALAFGLVCSAFTSSAQTISVSDDSGRRVTLDAPAQRIVSLAPHTTELLFAAGAGDRVVGVDEYSNYPPAVASITSVGSALQLDLERLLALRPDLVVVWSGGHPETMIEKLEALGLTVFRSEPRQLDDVASNLERLGQLAGTPAQALQAARAFRQDLAQLRREYQDRPRVRVFYQIWHQPLMTVNGEHLISKVMALCGGENIFADLPTLAPQVSTEAVVVADPQAIIASGKALERPDWLQSWLKWEALTAVKLDSVYVIHPDLIQRHTPRILQGAQQMCRHLEEVRGKLGLAGRAISNPVNGAVHVRRPGSNRQVEAQIPRGAGTARGEGTRLAPH